MSQSSPDIYLLDVDLEVISYFEYALANEGIHEVEMEEICEMKSHICTDFSLVMWI